jgi:DDE superfamily endonuclease
VIPPYQNAEFVAHLEDVLEIYHRPYDPKRPVICMDEQPLQLVKETRIPLPAQPGQPKSVDYEYERNGTANIFIFTEPLAGWRKAVVSERRTAVDWAVQIQRLLEEDYADSDTVLLVCDQLNIHKLASLYEAFQPAVARRLVEDWRFITRPNMVVGSILPRTNSQLSPGNAWIVGFQIVKR